MTNEDTDSKLKAAEEAVKRLEVFHPDSMELATALENYAWLLRSQKRLLDASNVKARADVIRAKHNPPPPPPPSPPKPTVPPPQKVIVRKYVGNESVAASAFQDDAPKMAAYNYYPTSQVWAPGSYGCATFLLALLLALIIAWLLGGLLVMFTGWFGVILVGALFLFIVIYMLIVKPSGTLTVTYELREPAVIANERACPSCAETIKAAAVICRFCNRNVDPIVIRPRESLESIAYTPQAEPLINEAPAKIKNILERPIFELLVGNRATTMQTATYESGVPLSQATKSQIKRLTILLLLALALLIVGAIISQFKKPSEPLAASTTEPQAATTAESPPAVQSIEPQARRAQLCRERLADMRDAILKHDWRRAKVHLGIALAHAEASGDIDLLAKVRL